MNEIWNILNKDYESTLKEVIKLAQVELKNLTKVQTCKIYSFWLSDSLNKKHILNKVINTVDLGFLYEHLFVLVPKDLMKKEYFVVDLTFLQFNNKEDKYKDLLENGYQVMNDLVFNEYLKNFGLQLPEEFFKLEDLFYDLHRMKKIG